MVIRPKEKLDTCGSLDNNGVSIALKDGGLADVTIVVITLLCVPSNMTNLVSIIHYSATSALVEHDLALGVIL